MTAPPLRRIVVAGGSTAGIAAAQALRAEGFDGELHLVSAEAHLPYDRTALSKALLLGQGGGRDIGLLGDDAREELGAVWHMGRRAAGLDAAARVVELDDGRELAFDGLVLATGSAARSLGVPAPSGVLALRDLDDAHALDAALGAARELVVVGGGFVGLEVAAVAAQRGCRVTVLEADAAPLRAALGDRVGRALTARHERHGVRIRTHARVAGFRGRDHVEGVVLDDRRTLSADLVVVGVGAAPNTAWLRTSTLGDRDGVPCDATLATPVPGVVAAGDIVRWPHPDVRRPVRVEHHEHAQRSGAHAARRLLRGPDAGAYTGVPFVWSQQYDHTIHIAGFPSPDAEVEVLEGDLDEGPFAVAFRRGDRRSAVMTLDHPRSFRRLRRDLSSEGAPA